MKLKEIKPGMAIHCKNDEEKKALYHELCRIGNIRPNLYEDSFPNLKNNRFSYLIKDLKNQPWGMADCATFEFSALILPELTAEEAIKFSEKYVKVHVKGVRCMQLNHMKHAKICVTRILRK